MLHSHDFDLSIHSDIMRFSPRCCFLAGLSFAVAQDSVSYDFDTYAQDVDSGSPFQTFESNSHLKPPKLHVHSNRTEALADGYVFMGVNGGPSSEQNWPAIFG